MNDLDGRLRRHQAEPRRALRADFTNSVIRKLEPMDKRPAWMEYLKFKTYKPVTAGLAVGGALLLGSTAYAAVGGISGVWALFGGQKTLSDGSRLVRIDTENCPHVDAFNVADGGPTGRGSYFYKINANSAFDNRQVVAMVQGACEADAESVMNGRIAQQWEKKTQNEGKLVGDYADSVIASVGPDHITIDYVMPFGTENRKVTHAFTKVDPGVLVVSQGMEQPYSSLKVGDHVSVTYKASGEALTHSETLAPDQVDASAQTVAIITKLSAHMSQYYDFQKYNRKDFIQVTTCDGGTDGYCTAEQYYNK